MSESVSYSQSFLNQYKKLDLVDSCMPDMPAPNPALSGMWELDQKMRAEFLGHIQMWEQGLIHSMELMQALNQITIRAR